jgi:acetolactate synthase-1/2/3 large subunit
MIKISDLIFNVIADYGIDTVFTVSGGGCMHLIDSLGKNKRLEYICNHHEQACAIAAESYARVKHKPGCILVTTGPGGTNTLTGVLCAYQDSIPMIVISGQSPTDQLSKHTGCRQIGQQEFNIVDTIKSMTKYSVTITDKRDILYHLEKAIYLAESGRPGPVWLDIPLDIQSSEVCLSTLKAFTRPKITRSIIDYYKRNQFLSLLKNSRKPIIVVGGGIRASNTVDKLKKFLDITKIPVMSGPHSAVDVINTDYEFYMGRFGVLGQRTSNQIIQESDLVISLGSRLNPKMTGYDQKQFAPNAKKMIIDIDKYEIKKLKFANKYSWNIDLNSFFDYVLPKTQYTNIELWHNYTRIKRLTENLVLDKHKNLTDYVSTYVFSNALEKYLSKDSIIVTSDGTAHVVPLKTINLKYNQRLFSNEGTAPMGYGLPAAIGAYYGSSLSPIVCIEGDGSIMMNLQELETLSHHKLPIKLFIINNQGYLSIKLTQNSFFKGHLVGSNTSSGVSIPSFAKIASAFSIPYVSITSNDKLDTILNNVFSTQALQIIELFCDPNELHEPKVSAKGVDINGKIIPGNLSDI